MFPRNKHSIHMRFMRPIILASIFLTSSCCYFDDKPKYSPDEQIWVEKALKLYSGPNADTREHLLSYTTPVVVYLPELVCVAFKLKPTALGGEFTVCFSKAKGSVEFTHTEGQ